MGTSATTKKVQHEAGDSWDLVAAAQAGDHEAFGQLYTRYADTVTGFLVRRTGRDRALVEDLTQETFLRAWRRIDTAHADRGRDVGAWLATIARNLVTDHYKSARVQRERVTGEPSEAGPVEDGPEQRVIEQLDRDTVVASVRRAVGRLTPGQRRVVELYDLGSADQLRDVAAQMGRSIGAVKTLHHSAMRALRGQLAGEGITSSRPSVQAVRRARAAVDQLAQQHHELAGLRSSAAATAADRWAGQSVAAAIGTEVIAR